MTYCFLKRGRSLLNYAGVLQITWTLARLRRSHNRYQPGVLVIKANQKHCLSLSISIHVYIIPRRCDLSVILNSVNFDQPKRERHYNIFEKATSISLLTRPSSCYLHRVRCKNPTCCSILGMMFGSLYASKCPPGRITSCFGSKARAYAVNARSVGVT